MNRFIDELKKFETHFRVAVEHNVLSRNIMVSDRKRLHEIENEIFGDNGNFRQSCRGCLMATLRRLGAAYLDYINKGIKEPAQETVKEQAAPVPEKKKRGRKPAVKVEKDEAFVPDDSINEIFPDETKE